MWTTPGTQQDFKQDLQKVRITSFCGVGCGFFLVFCLFVFLFLCLVFTLYQNTEDLVLLMVA